MNFEYQLDKDDINTLHGIMAEVTDKWDYTDQEIKLFWGILPLDIKLDAVKWGVSDTPTKDAMYLFFIDNREVVENQILEANISDSSITL